ncbi:MAG: class I SAM-dependent methyltransferase [Pseudomonadota bacterium]
MTATPSSFKLPAAFAGGDLPRMVGDGDVALIASVASVLPPGAVAVEFGPWLGGLSVEIAPHADLHAVDSFVWTEDHDRRVPGLCAPGESFLAHYMAVLEELGLTATPHETLFEAFTWGGGPIDLVVIDGPKKARDLAPCLTAIWGSLKRDARILIKNGLKPFQTDVTAYLDAIVSDGHAEPVGGDVPVSSNILCLRPLDTDRPLPAAAAGQASGALLSALDLAPEHPFRLAPIVEALGGGNAAAAYDALSRMPPERRLRRQWEKQEPQLRKMKVDRDLLATFSEMLAIHHAALPKALPEHFHQSGARALRGHWLNSAGRESRGRDFWPEVIQKSHAFGYLHWPSKVRAHVHGKAVLDIGCGPGLHGIGYLAAGATRYVGLDPIIEMGRDRVKNVAERRKEAFGWTPQQIADRLETWEVLGLSIEDFDADENFDIVTMHNVTEHLHGIEQVFGEIGRLLRDGGKLLFNHHNYYAWNGHHCRPKSVAELDASDPAQAELIDWRHIDIAPPPDHYISRGLNRIRLDALRALTERYFEIEVWDMRPSSPDVGGDRLTDSIRAAHPDLNDLDFLTQNVFCLATVRR